MFQLLFYFITKDGKRSLLAYITYWCIISCPFPLGVQRPLVYLSEAMGSRFMAIDADCSVISSSWYLEWPVLFESIFSPTSYRTIDCNGCNRLDFFYNLICFFFLRIPLPLERSPPFCIQVRSNLAFRAVQLQLLMPIWVKYISVHLSSYHRLITGKE